MNRNSIITKSIGYLILIVMSYQFFCSVLCAVTTDGCCGKEEQEHHGKCCNSNNNDNNEKPRDCQDMHLAFFKTLGQFGIEKGLDAPKDFHKVIAIIHSLFIVESVINGSHSFAYTGFQPPPPKEDIRIFIQSFLI